jgi:hypothetical protein
LEATIAANEMIKEQRLGSQLVIWVGNRDSASEGINIKLCRPSADREIDCGNNQDDDCDGLTDAADSDCTGDSKTPQGGRALKNNLSLFGFNRNRAAGMVPVYKYGQSASST